MDNISSAELFALLSAAVALAIAAVRIVEKSIDALAAKKNGKKNNNGAAVLTREAIKAVTDGCQSRMTADVRQINQAIQKMHNDTLNLARELREMSRNNKVMSDNMLVLATKLDQWQNYRPPLRGDRR